jgi:hypothetical protein
LLHIFGVHRGGLLSPPERPSAIEPSAAIAPTVEQAGIIEIASRASEATPRRDFAPRDGASV